MEEVYNIDFQKYYKISQINQNNQTKVIIKREILNGQYTIGKPVKSCVPLAKVDIWMVSLRIFLILIGLIDNLIHVTLYITFSIFFYC